MESFFSFEFLAGQNLFLVFFFFSLICNALAAPIKVFLFLYLFRYFYSIYCIPLLPTGFL